MNFHRLFFIPIITISLISCKDRQTPQTKVKKTIQQKDSTQARSKLLSVNAYPYTEDSIYIDIEFHIPHDKEEHKQMWSFDKRIHDGKYKSEYNIEYISGDSIKIPLSNDTIYGVSSYEKDGTVYWKNWIYFNYGWSLLQTDYCKYVPEDSLSILRNNILFDFNIYDANLYRFALVDTEELAEFNYDFIQEELNNVLKERNFKLKIKKQEANNYTSHVIIINDSTFQLYTQHDLENNNFWDIASRNFFKVINSKLKESKIEEQFYLLYSGNDLTAVLLTKYQAQIIIAYYSKNKLIKETPYLP